jgi:hypothetical protein
MFPYGNESLSLDQTKGHRPTVRMKLVGAKEETVTGE